MLNFRSNMHIVVNAKIYRKYAVSGALGKKILATGIELINEMGFEQITFRKPGSDIGSIAVC